MMERMLILNRMVIRIFFIAILILFGWSCNIKDNNEQKFKLKTIWEYDSISGDSVLRPLNNEFDKIVKLYLDSIKNEIPEFMYNVFLDTAYSRYDMEGSSGRSIRAAIISQIEDKELLEKMINDKRLNEVWDDAKRDSVILRTNVEMANVRLKLLLGR